MPKTTDEAQQKIIKSPYKIDPAEYARAMEETRIEREWYAPLPALETLDDIHTAVAAGRLVKVEPTANYLPIMRYRNPDLVDKYPPYLTPEALLVLEELTDKWRIAMNSLRISPKIRLALSSLTRTAEYQQKLIEAGSFAQENSPHTYGEAFDIDSAGYYVGDKPMNPRVAVREKYEKGFAELGANDTPPEYANLDHHDVRVTFEFRKILEAEAAKGHIHFIVEFAGTENEIYHVCRNPEYVPTRAS